jgi:hypothetical protein
MLKGLSLRRVEGDELVAYDGINEKRAGITKEERTLVLVGMVML